MPKTTVRCARSVLALALAGGLAIAVALPNPASASAGTPGPWKPFSSSPFTETGGDVCAFPLHGGIVTDHEKIRTLAVDSSGKATEYEITGQLVVRYTNEATGASVDRDLTGTAWLHYHADGSQTWIVAGHLGLGIHASNPLAPQGFSILTGRITLEITADHHPHVTSHHGRTEDLCRTLSREADWPDALSRSLADGRVSGSRS